MVLEVWVRLMPKISDLFDLGYGHSLELNRLEQSDAPDAINFVGRAAKNNGVTARVKPLNGVSPSVAGSITVALNGQGGAGVAFLQPFPFYTGFHIMVLTPKVSMTEQEKLWWVTCITANRFRFGFGRQANRTLKDLDLPSPEKVPEWVMGAEPNCYEGTELPARQDLVSLPDISDWKGFQLEQLFDIRKGRRLTKAAMTSGMTPFVGASDSNNGMTAQVGQPPNHSGGTISVSYNGSVAEAFFQPLAFWAADDVNVLYPKGFELSEGAALFVCTVIRLEKYRFNYGRKWHLDRMRESVIKLPVDPKGDPDWGLMEQYIKTLPYSSQLT